MRRSVWLGLLFCLLTGCQGSAPTSVPTAEATPATNASEPTKQASADSSPNSSAALPTTNPTEPSKTLVSEQLEITIDFSSCEEQGLDVPLDYRNAVIIVAGIIPDQKCNLRYLEDFRIGDPRRYSHGSNLYAVTIACNVPTTLGTVSLKIIEGDLDFTPISEYCQEIYPPIP